MRNCLRRVRNRAPWLWVLPTVLLPLLPEYVSPLLVIALFFIACFDASEHHERLRIGRIGKLLLVYIAYMAIGIAYSSYPVTTASSVLMWGMMFLLYLSLTTLLRSRRRMNQLFAGIAVAAGIAGLIAVVQYVGLTLLGWEISPFFWDPVDMAVFDALSIQLNHLFAPGAIRTGSTFNNQNMFAEYLTMAIPFACHYAFNGKCTAIKRVTRVCLLFAVAGVAVSLCRGAYLALLLMVIVMVVFLSSSRLPTAITAAVGLACLPQSVTERFLSIGAGDKSTMNRLAQWQVALYHAAERPLFGYGAGVSITSEMLHAAGLDAPHMHNLVLMLLIEGGLPSVILMGAIIFTVLRYSMDMMILLRNRPLSVTLLAFVGGFVTISMFDFPLMTPKLVAFFLLVMAIADATAHLELNHPWNVRFFRSRQWLNPLSSQSR